MASAQKPVLVGIACKAGGQSGRVAKVLNRFARRENLPVRFERIPTKYLHRRKFPFFDFWLWPERELAEKRLEKFGFVVSLLSRKTFWEKGLAQLKKREGFSQNELENFRLVKSKKPVFPEDLHRFKSKFRKELLASLTEAEKSNVDFVLSHVIWKYLQAKGNVNAELPESKSG